MSVRIYQRIAPRTGISMAWWLAPFVYLLWFAAWLAIAAVWLLGALALAGWHAIARHRS